MPTPTPPRSTSASASTTTTTASCRCWSACRPPKQQMMADAEGRAATCRSTASPPTTRRCRAWCSAPTAPLVKAGRVATVQALGGTGGLKIGADFLKRLNPDAKVLISDPSWENHRALFTSAGFAVETYPYYDAATRGIASTHARRAERRARRARSSCCTPAATTRPATTCRRRSGRRSSRRSRRATSCPSSTWPTRASATASPKTARSCGQFVDAGLDFFVSTSFSKSFSLYGERVGALSVVCASKRRSRARAVPAEDRDPHQLLQPADARRAGRRHGADHAGAARAVGRGTGRHARAHQADARRAGQDKLAAAGVKRDLSFITEQNGMFSYSGLGKAQMERLRNEFGIYGVDSGPHLRGRAEHAATSTRSSRRSRRSLKREPGIQGSAKRSRFVSRCGRSEGTSTPRRRSGLFRGF